MRNGLELLGIAAILVGAFLILPPLSLLLAGALLVAGVNMGRGDEQ